MAEQTEPSDSSGFDIELLLKQARTYLAFGEQVQPFSERFHETLDREGDWGNALRQHFDQLKTVLAEAADDPGGHPELARLWTITLDTWQQTAASLGIPAPFAASLADPNSEAWQAYQRVLGQYFELLRQAARDALDLMERRLDERAAAGATVESLRALYNLWVECNEDTYGRMLRGPDYAELNGRLLNTLLGCYSRGGAPA